MALVTCGLNCFSQITKGKWLAGGNASFNYNKTTGVFLNSSYIEQTTWQFSPGAGYFFVDKLAGGIRINYRLMNNHADQGISSDRQLSLSPFVRYYFLPKKEKINLFADAGYFFGRTSLHFLESPGSGASSYTMKQTVKGYSVAAGPVIFLNNKTALELTVNFIKNGNLSYSHYGHTIDIMAGLGFQVHLGK